MISGQIVRSHHIFPERQFVFHRLVLRALNFITMSDYQRESARETAI